MSTYIRRIKVPLLLLLIALGPAALFAETPAKTVEPPPALYKLQPNDEITVFSIEGKEIADKKYRIGDDGEVNFPLIGIVRLKDLTVREAEAVLVSRLKKFYVDPSVALTITSFHPEPVSVIGAVGTPGIQQIHATTTVLDVLSSAGGIRTDAGPVAVITRQPQYGPLPLPGAHTEGNGTSVAEIQIRSLLNAKNPAENIPVFPSDVVSVPPAEIVYVVGNVKRAGGFPLGGKTNLSVLQALSLAEGLDARAAPKNARILRRGVSDADHTEVPVDVKKILEGKAEDVLLRPNDILFIPNSAAKSVTARSLEAALQIATGLAIYRY